MTTDLPATTMAAGCPPVKLARSRPADRRWVHSTAHGRATRVLPGALPCQHGGPRWAVPGGWLMTGGTAILPLPGARPGPLPGRRPPWRGIASRRPAPRAAICAARPASHGLAAGRAAVAHAGPVHAGADAGRVSSAGRRVAGRRPAVDPAGPAAGRPAGRPLGPGGRAGPGGGAGPGGRAVVGGSRGDRGCRRVRCRAADLSLRADHRPAWILPPTSSSRPGLPGMAHCRSRDSGRLSEARICSPSPARPSTESAAPSCRSSWPGCQWRWPPPSGPAGSAPRCWSAPGARGGGGAHLRRLGGPASRTALGAARGPGPRTHPA